MQIFIKTLTGRKQQYNFEAESTVLSVKQTLQEKVFIKVFLL
jgi:ubiquitin-like protein Nedd8